MLENGTIRENTGIIAKVSINSGVGINLWIKQLERMRLKPEMVGICKINKLQCTYGLVEAADLLGISFSKVE